MKIVTLQNLATGTWYRDCELISIQWQRSIIDLVIYKESTNNKWRIRFHCVVMYKVISEEVAFADILGKLPHKGGFFEIFESPMFRQYYRYRKDVLNDMHHFVYCCYDEVIEVIAKDFTVTEVKDEVISR